MRRPTLVLLAVCALSVACNDDRSVPDVPVRPQGTVLPTAVCTELPAGAVTSARATVGNATGVAVWVGPDAALVPVTVAVTDDIFVGVADGEEKMTVGVRGSHLAVVFGSHDPARRFVPIGEPGPLARPGSKAELCDGSGAAVAVMAKPPLLSLAGPVGGDVLTADGKLAAVVLDGVSAAPAWMLADSLRHDEE